jgi:tRNA(adenine34) deaminase
MTESLFGAHQDHLYMAEALTLAGHAAQSNEVPIGAVLVDGDGAIIAKAYNTTEQSCSQVAHAELAAIQEAGTARQNWRLSDCWLYVTLEPCIMCMGCIYLSRLAGLVYGAPSHQFGLQLDNAVLLPVYRVNTLRVVAGVCAEESQKILRTFFRTKRSSDNAKK